MSNRDIAGIEGLDRITFTFIIGMGFGAALVAFLNFYAGSGSADEANKRLLDLQQKNDSITQVLDRKAIEAYAWEIRAENHKKTADSLQLEVVKYDSLLSAAANKRAGARARTKAANQDELLNRFHEIVR